MASLVNRYSVALFEVARDKECLDEVDQDLALLRGAWKASSLRKMLDNPQIAKAQRVKALHAILGAHGRVANPLTLRFVQLLVEKGRQQIIAGVAKAFHAQALLARGIIEGTLHTALPIDQEGKSALQSALGVKLGNKVQLTEVIDESLLGGFRVLVGDSMFDLSLRGQIEELSRKLKGVSLASTSGAGSSGAGASDDAS